MRITSIALFMKVPPVVAALASFFFANTATASPAPAIWQFDVLAVTSATYNPNPPSGLTPDTALQLLNWDVVYGPSQFKTSNLHHGGGWIAFVTETGGYSANYYPYASYSGATLTYFGQHLVVDGTNTVIGFDDEWICVCNGGNTFSAFTYSINGGRYWSAQMYVQ